MPIYDYACKECGDEFREQLKVDDRRAPTEQPCRGCGGEITLLIGAPMICDPVRMGVVKPSSQFNDVLTKIHERVPGSKLGEKLQGSRPENTGTDNVKAREAARKFAKKISKAAE